MTIEEAITYWEGLHKTFSSQFEKEENHFGRMHLQHTLDVLDTTIAALREPKRERGEWRKTQEPLGWEDVECIECPVCRQSWIVEDEYGFPDWSFCPCCGADMRPEGGAEQ